MDAPMLIIGDERVTLKPVTFATTKLLMPIFGKMSAPTSTIALREAMVEALSALLGETVEDLTARIIFREFDVLDAQWPVIMEWIGLVAPKPGEAPATS